MVGIDLTNFSMLIPSEQNWAVGLALWIVLGLIVGFIGSKIFNKTGYGLLRDCLLGIAGVIVVGCFSNLIGRKFSGTGLELYGEPVAVIGAVVFMFVNYALFRRGFPQHEVLVKAVSRREIGGQIRLSSLASKTVRFRTDLTNRESEACCGQY